MNDSNFEDSLRALLPHAPSAALEERIAADLSANLSACEPASLAKEAAPRERQPVSIRFEQAPEPLLVRCFHSLGWAIAGAASAVAAIALCSTKPAAEKSDPRPVSISTASIPAAAASPPPIASTPSSPSEPSEPSSAVVSSLLPASVESDFQALETTRELVSTEEGNQVIYRTDNSPMRQVRYTYLERHAWTNSRTGARMEIEVPREDVFLKPVSLQ